MEYLDNIPITLYKYRQWDLPYHQKALTDYQIFLSSPSLFNDPFDASVPFKYKKEDLTPENIYKKLWIVGKQNWPDLDESELPNKIYERQNSGIFDNDEYWKSEHEKLKENVHKTFGILSLTTKYDNLLMWSHYGNSHKGFCIGFDSKKLYEAVTGSIGPVIYSSHFPEVDLFDNSINSIVRILNTKSEHWQYEDEYRITKHEAANKTFVFSPDTITEIILGCKMPMKYKQEIYKILDSKLPHVKLFEAETDLYDFKLNINSITKL